MQSILSSDQTWPRGLILACALARLRHSTVQYSTKLALRRRLIQSVCFACAWDGDLVKWGHGVAAAQYTRAGAGGVLVQ